MAKDTPSCLVSLPDLTVTESSVTLSVLRIRSPESVLQELSSAFGVAWAMTPNHVFGDAPEIAWLAPGEWALFAEADALRSRIETACAHLAHHLVDVSAGRRRWRVGGALARDLLAKGCSLDTDPRVFAPCQCAQTLLAHVRILLIPRSASDFDVIADVSLAGHLRAWLADAALEYQP